MTENTPEGTLDTEEAQIEAMLAPVDNEPPQESDEPEEPKIETEEEAEGNEVEELAPEEAEETEETPDLVEVYDPDEDTFKQVSRDEAKGYGLRQADYTRKTQEVAEVRKTAEAELAELREERSQLQQALVAWAVQPEQEPNWAQLATQYSAQEVFAAQHHWKERQARSEKAKEAYRQLQEQQTQEEQQRIAERKEEAVNSLLMAFPHWTDKAKANSDLAEAISVGQDYGFTQEELASQEFVDDRIIKALMDLRELKKIRGANASAKKVARETKTLEPGARSTKEQQSKKREQEKLARVKKTGGDTDAFADWLLG